MSTSKEYESRTGNPAYISTKFGLVADPDYARWLESRLEWKEGRPTAKGSYLCINEMDMPEVLYFDGRSWTSLLTDNEAFPKQWRVI